MTERRVATAARTERLTRWALPLATLIFFVATARGYGIFRDELYYLACGKHLAWGYVDQPPFVALVARVAHALFGDSLVGLRLFPSLAAAKRARPAQIRMSKAFIEKIVKSDR